MSTIERAIAIAAEAHAGQRDHGGQAYIFHPLRVMTMVRPVDRIVAVLHDVVEDHDGDWPFERLAREGFGEHVEALDALCRRTHERTYADFIRRAASHPVAARVKLQDVVDNLNPERLKLCTAPVRQRLMVKYAAALPILVGARP